MKQLRKLQIAIVAIIVFTLGANIKVEAGVDETLIKESEEKVDELSEEKERIIDKINEKEKTIEELMLEIELLKEEKSEIEEIIKDNEKEISKVQVQIDKLKEEIDELQESIDVRSEIVSNRLVAYQSKGNIEYLDVVFGSDSFMDMISRVHAVSVIMKADTDMIEGLKNDLDLVEDKMNEVREMKLELEAIKRENEDKKADLEDNIKTTTKNKKDLNQQIEDLNVSTEEIEKEQEELIDKINKELGMKIELGSGELEWPTDGGYISSGVGSRLHPISGKVKLHKGIDIARTDRSVSPPIYSAEDGVVVEVNSGGGYGNVIKIKHDDGVETLYAHLASTRVKKGQEVRRGQTVGIMGTTGMSTGIHLHFEVYKDGNLQNPLRYIK